MKHRGKIGSQSEKNFSIWLRVIDKAFFPDKFLYHSTVNSTDWLKFIRSVQFRLILDLVESSNRTLDSWGWTISSRTQIFFETPHDAVTASDNCSTVKVLFNAGPKFQGPSMPLSICASTSFKYPFKQSNTCCQGRIASGKRRDNVLLLVSASIKSGMIRSDAQSPPPITFPDRAMATGARPKLFAHDCVAMSAAALEALYGSSPPSSSVSI